MATSANSDTGINEKAPSNAASLAAASRSSSLRHANGSQPASRSTSLADVSIVAEDEQSARQRWNTFPDGWYIVSPEELRLRADAINVLIILAIRNYVAWLREDLDHQERRLADLHTRMPMTETSPWNYIVGYDQLWLFLYGFKPRVESTISAIQKLPNTAWEERPEKDLATSYYLFQDHRRALESAIDELWALGGAAAETAKMQSNIPLLKQYANEQAPPISSLDSATIGVRGPAETSNTRVLRFANDRRRSTAPDQPPAQLNHHAPPAASADMSKISSYKTTFQTLGTVGFFGASVAWGSVFTASLGNISLLSWAAAAFAVGSKSAAAMSIVVGSDTIDIDRDMGARRVVRTFAITGAIHIFAGVILLSVAVMLLDPAAPSGGSHTSIHGSRGAQIGAGVFSIVVSTVVILIALFTRFYYVPEWYKYRM